MKSKSCIVISIIIILAAMVSGCVSIPIPSSIPIINEIPILGALF